MNYGYQNEVDFVNYFNGRYFNDFDDNSKRFLHDLFDGNISNDIPLKAWKNRINQKADFFIRYKNYIKCISLKCGNNNSIHHESIQDFRLYLESLNIPYKVIEYYVSYHYGYAKDDNGNTDFSKRLSANDYKQLYQEQLDIFNSYINKTRIIIDMIDRFLVKGKNSEYDIDIFVSGTIDDFNWIKKHDLYDLILSKRKLKFTSPHCSCMTFGPKKRNLDNLSNCKERYIVAVRWNFIKEEIDNFKLLNNL